MSGRKTFLFCILLLYSSPLFSQNQAEKKMALVIGVKNYTHVSPLQNTLNDARGMAATLKGKGFQVIELYDPKTKREMQDAIRRYFDLLQSDKNAAGLVFYSGHGMQVDGANYLIPAHADPKIKADLDDQCLNMDYVMRAIEQAGNPLNIFILDACRNNPFKGFYRSSEQGLNMVTTPKGSYIVYATKPGSVASDGTAGNGLFTSKLLKWMNAEGLNIEQVFKRVAADVASESNDAQRPWIASDYTGDFYFTPGKAVTNPQVTYTQPITQPEVKTELRQPETTTEPANKAFDYGYGSADALTVTVGSQQWIGKNLNVTAFANGDPIPQAQTDDEWENAEKNKQPAWCYFNNDPANGRTYGKLYNWYAVHDPRGLAPQGWHVPSDQEWTSLTSYLGGETIAGNKMKSSILWADNNGASGNGNNSSGIAGLPGGFRDSNGAFGNMGGKGGSWWSSSEGATDKAWYRDLHYNAGRALRGDYGKSCGFSVRCLRD